MRRTRSNASKRRRETGESSAQGEGVGIEHPRPQEELIDIQVGVGGWAKDGNERDNLSKVQLL